MEKKYLIWGTGNIAKLFLSTHINEFFFRNEIVAFADNDIKKKGKLFFDKKIILPYEIEEYTFDVILICCSAEKSIIRQIREQLKFQGMVLTMKDILIAMYSFYHDELRIYDKKIVVVGNPNNRETNLSRVYIFKEAEYVEINQVEKLKSMEYDYVLCTWPSEYWHISSDKRYEIVERKLIEKIVEAGGVDRKLVLTFSVTGIYWSVDKRYSLGEENPRQVFLLIKPGVGTVGLGGVILQVIPNIVYAKRNRMIPVIDMESFKNSYVAQDRIGKESGWEKFFKQPGQWHVRDIQRSKNIVESMVKRPNITIDEEDLNKYLEAQPILKKEVDEYCNTYFIGSRRILGVLVRGSDYVIMKPYAHCIQPDIGDMLRVVREKFESGGYDLIYLCTEEEAVVNLFNEEFGKKVFYYPSKRVECAVKGYLSESSMYREQNLYRVGADYWITLNALSKCNALVAGDCSGTQVAILLNQSRYEEIYVFKLGRYGIDDIVSEGKGEFSEASKT